MLVIETIDGLTTIAPAAEPERVWVFDTAAEALGFIQAWWADDVATVESRPWSGVVT